MKVLPSKRIGRVVVTYSSISGKDYCDVGLGPKFLAAYPIFLGLANFTCVGDGSCELDDLFTCSGTVDYMQITFKYVQVSAYSSTAYSSTTFFSFYSPLGSPTLLPQTVGIHRPV